jgi:glucose-1-phosphate adenylyltransferase
MHNCDISESMVTEGCIMLGVNVRRSIIGLRSRIGHGTSIEDSIIMGADFYQPIEELSADLREKVPHVGIGENTVIRRAIVDKNARIGSNVKLLNQRNLENEDGENYHIRDGIIVIPKNAVVKDGTVI